MRASDECNDLVDEAIGFGEQQLVKHGEFIPYGAKMQNDGSIVMVAANVDEEFPQSDDVIAALRDIMRGEAQAGEIRASCIFYDVKTKIPATGEDADAIAAAVDHREDYSVLVLYPYQVHDNNVAYADPFASKGEAAIFS